jgi:hypothetical protein
MHMTLKVSVAGARLAGIVGIWILVAPGMAAGQMTRDPREHARSRLGPFYVTPTIELAELGVETNVFNEPDSRSDISSTLMPHADVWVPFGRRALITASGTLGLIYFQTFASERAVNPDGRIRGDLRVNRVTLFAGSGYSTARRRPNLEIDARARQETRRVEAGASARLTERLSLRVAASESRIAFEKGAVFEDTSLREVLNRRVRSGLMSAGFEVTPLTRVEVRGEFAEERFPFSPVRDADSLSLSPTVEFQPRALISGSASVGIRRFRPKSERLPDFSGVVANVGLSYALRGATRFKFTAVRDLAYSYSDAEPYYVLTGYGLTILRHLRGRFDVMAGGDWQRHRYRRLALVGPVEPLAPALGPPSPPALNVNTIRTWTAGLGYRLWREQRLGFGATYRERSTTREPDLAYSGLRIMLTVDSGI